MGASSVRLPEPIHLASTLVDILRWRAANQCDRLAYRFLLNGATQQTCLTYGDLDQKARTIAGQLQALGNPGDRALLVYPPGLDFITSFFGCLYSGKIAIPAFPPHGARMDQAAQRIVTAVKDANPIVALMTSSMRNKYELLFERVRELRPPHCIVTDSDAHDCEDEWRDPGIVPENVAFLQYTSGSTATPRGVMVSHGNLASNVMAIQTCFGMSPKSHAVSWLPPYHDMGLIGGILTPIHAGIPITLMSPLHFLQRPFRWLQAISQSRGMVSGGPNFAYDLCIRKITPEQRADLDLSGWEVAFNGAEPIKSDTLERFAAYFEPCGFRAEAFYPCYGLAEATLFVSGGWVEKLPATRHFRIPVEGHCPVVPCAIEESGGQPLVGCGRTLEHQELIIVDPDTLVQCLPKTIGEIWLSGSNVAEGYWNRPEETELTFRARTDDETMGTFLRTGDLGFLVDGELFVVGRLKDLIIIDGKNHHPEDIERTVAECHHAVRPGGTAAFSIDTSDGEQLVVVVEVQRKPKPDLAAIIRTVRKAVADQHELHSHDIVLLQSGRVPRTASGKIQRHACKADYLSSSLSAKGVEV